MGWLAITVESALADAVASELLGMASDPGTWKLENFGSAILRLRGENEDRFYFSPRAATLFEPFVAAHAGIPCEPPLSRRLAPARTSRLPLGFKSRWESFQQPRLVSKPGGLSKARPTGGTQDSSP